jgi:hypothetical protein
VLGNIKKIIKSIKDNNENINAEIVKKIINGYAKDENIELKLIK